VLLSVLTQHTLVDFRYLTDSVVDQPLAPLASTYFDSFQKINRLCKGSASCQNEVGPVSEILSVLFLLSVRSKGIWVYFINLADSDLAQRLDSTHLGLFH